MTKAMNYGKENGFSGISMEENYHMNLDALKAFMPEKYRLLVELHDEIGGTFCKNSTPVYDVNTGRIYFSIGLDRISGTSDYASIFIKVRESLNNGIPVKGFWAKGKNLRYKEGMVLIMRIDMTTWKVISFLLLRTFQLRFLEMQYGISLLLSNGK